MNGPSGRGEAPVAAGVGFESPPALRHVDSPAGALVAGVGHRGWVSQGEWMTGSRTSGLPHYRGGQAGGDAVLERRLAWTGRTVPVFGDMPTHAVAEMLRESMNAFIGTPEELVAQIGEFAAAGADEVMVQWIGMDDIDGLEVLAEQVLPAVWEL